MADEGSDSFDLIITIMQFLVSKSPAIKETVDQVIEKLTAGRRYLKGEYKANCANENGSKVPDHCRYHALSDPKETLFQQKCNHAHTSRCNDCENLKEALKQALAVITQNQDLTTKERNDFIYDVEQAIKNIEMWKTHILTVVHQEGQKTDLLQELDNETAFIIIDFAMKFLEVTENPWRNGSGKQVMACM